MARFTTTIELGGRTATGFAVPDAVVDGLGSGTRPKVKVTIGRHSYRTTVARMDGRFMVPLAAEHREAAGVAAGDEVKVDLVLDTEPREVAVPDDLSAALQRRPSARKTFDALAYSHRKEWVRSVEDAKKPETRQRRIDKCVEAMLEAVT
jgi:Bacteriocin-protection, YdeI or OmpD-Associated/Domain of unknown function (DUF1905)